MLVGIRPSRNRNVWAAASVCISAKANARFETAELALGTQVE